MKNKNIKYVTEEQKEVKKFLIVVVVLVIAVVGVYFFTKAFVTKSNEVTYQDGVINYDVAIVGNMLEKNEKDYYVLAFNGSSNDANYYSTLIASYKKKDKALKVYTVDLDNELNKKYVSEKEEDASKSFESLEKLKLGKVTLIKVSDKKVTSFKISEEDIKKELAI